MTRGSCASASRQLTHQQFFAAQKEAPSFSLFSDPSWLHGTTTAATAAAATSSYFVHDNDGDDGDDGGDGDGDDDGDVDTDEHSETTELRNVINKLQERIDALDKMVSDLQHQSPPQQQPAAAPVLSVERIRTLEGRQASLQSKVAALDTAFGGTSAAAWQRGCRRLKEVLGPGLGEGDGAGERKVGASRSFDSLVGTALAATLDSEPEPTL